MFKRKGIDSFIDNNIKRGTSIGPELIEAIRGSKIKIVLLSRNYASSSWCLDELAEIMNCREVLGHMVMTVFYEVDPTDVRKQTGSFEKAFKRTCKGETKERIERWTKALEDVAEIAGEHSRNWVNEAAMIEKIATDVSNILINSTPSRDIDGLVGMGAHLEMLEQLIRPDLDEVRMIGIWGLPGIGKSTIARVLFNQFSSSYQLTAIMMDIKRRYRTPCLNEFSAQLQLQNQMLSQIVNHKGDMISHLEVAQERLKHKKVLLVLGDVDHSSQLHALAKEIKWFGPGSRIIITTEDERVLKAHGIKHIYKVDLPSSSEAFQIFCMHAFGEKHPDDGFYELAWEVMALAGELPLGLKVLGSAVRGLSKKEWERRLPRLKTCLDGEIESIIKFSYEALGDEEKYLFLYIACLYSFQIAHRVEELLAKQIVGVGQSLDILAEKSLIFIDQYGRIEMHTLLEQFGIKTSCEQFIIHGRAKRQILVGERDICEVLSDDTTDHRRFIGINLDLSKIEEELNISEKAIESMCGLQFVKIDDDGVANSERLHSLVFHSQKIRSLRWYSFQNICLPSTFNPEFLVELVMCDSKLQKLWDGTKSLCNLKWMDLRYSKDLKELPNLSTATKLDLSYCKSLVEFPSIGNATKLEELNLSNCSSLLKLPSSINATNLQILSLTNCSRVVELPTIENVTNLQILHLCNCSSLLELPLSIGTATNLQDLDISGCSSLVKLPSSIGDITNLERFDLSNCSSLVDLPSSIRNLQKLESLEMCGCSKLGALPANINLESLFILDLTDCSQLKSFPEISTNIEDLSITGTSIKEVPLSIMSWSQLPILKLSYFESLKDFPQAFDIITELLLNEEDMQEVPQWFKGMSSLCELRLHNCNNLVSLPQFSDSLSYIEADNCKSLERLDCTFNNPEICLKFTNCFKLNQEARDLIMHTSTTEYAILPGTLVPACFDYRATAGGPFTIKLKERHLYTSVKFKACIVFIMDIEETRDDTGILVAVNIMDKHNDLRVLPTPSKHYIDPLLTEHIYTFDVETDEVTSTELVFEFKPKSRKWKIRECGLYQMLEVNEHDESFRDDTD